jgi:hypothetical protein
MADQEPALPIPSPVASPVAPTPLIPSAGGLLPIPGDVTQTSESWSRGSSGKVATPGLRNAMADRVSADNQQLHAGVQQIGAAEQGADAINLEQQAKEATLRKDLALKTIEAQDAEGILKRRQEVENAAAKRIAQDEERYRQMDNQTFWGESKTWQKVLWGVSLALGGYGSSLSRGQNTPLLLLTKTVDDWGDKHEARMKALAGDISKGKSDLGTVGVEYALKEQQLLPLRKAAAYGRIGDLAEKEAEALVAAGKADAAARAQKLVADARAKAAEEQQKATKNAVQEQQFLAPTFNNEQRGGKITQGPKRNAPLEIYRRDGTPVGNAKTEGEAEKIRAGQAATNSLGDSLKEFKGFIGREGTWTSGLFEPSATKEREGLVSNVAGYLTKMFETGVLNQGEYDRYKSMLDSKFFQTREGAQKVLDQIEAGADRAYKRKVESQGLKYGQDSASTQAKLSPADQEAVDWARANPNDPRSAQILKANGL